MVWTVEDVETCTAFNIHAGFDSSGNPHIGYCVSVAGGVEFKHAWREAGVWDTEVIGSFTYGYTQIGFGWAIRDDVMHAAWINYPNPSFPYGNLTITHATAAVGGGWSTETHVPSAYGIFGGGISVAINSTGNWHLFWLGWQSGIPGRAIYVNSSWAETVIQSSTGQVGWSSDHNFYCDDDDVLHAFWYKQYPTDMEGIFYANSGDWSVQNVYTREIAGDLYAHCVAVNADGDVRFLADISSAMLFILGVGGDQETFNNGYQGDVDLLPKAAEWWGAAAPWYDANLYFEMRNSDGDWTEEVVVAGSSGSPSLLISVVGVPSIAFYNDGKLRFATRGVMHACWSMFAAFQREEVT